MLTELPELSDSWNSLDGQGAQEGVNDRDYEYGDLLAAPAELRGNDPASDVDD